MVSPLSPDRLIAVWEDGMRRHPIDRALLLFALSEPGEPPETLADAPIGQRNASLMALHRALFGTRLATWADCPACGERMELDTDISQLPPVPAQAPAYIEAAGLRFRRPTSRHLAGLAAITDPEAAARQLLRECAEKLDALPRDDEALSQLMDVVEPVLEAVDPWADLSLVVHCPTCGHEGSATLDIAEILWDEIDSHAQSLLDEVHALAQAYGWSEPQILALSHTRRTAYLARVQS